MKTTLLIAGIILIGISFYSIVPVLCDELFQNACYKIHGTEYYYTVLPYFLPVFATGIIIVLKSADLLRRPARKNLAVGSGFTISLIVVLVLYYGQPFVVEIVDLKEQYNAGEPVTFGIRTVGFGNVCSIPHVTIKMQTQTLGAEPPPATSKSTQTYPKMSQLPDPRHTPVWTNSDTTGCIGDSQYMFFNKLWEYQDITNGDDSIVINKTGSFKLTASHGNRITEEQFDVVP